MLVGAMLPWAEGMVGLLPVRFGGFDGAADGLILAGFSIVALLFARSPDFLDAPDGARALGAAAARPRLRRHLAARLAGRSDARSRAGRTTTATARWRSATGSPGLGALIVAVVGTYATLRYHEGQTSDPTALIRRPRRSDTVPIVTVIGAIAGLALGAWVALPIFPPSAVSAPMLFMAAIGVIVGGYLGRAVGRVIQRRLTSVLAASASSCVRRRIRDAVVEAVEDRPGTPARRARPDGTASSTSGA